MSKSIILRAICVLFCFGLFLGWGCTEQNWTQTGKSKDSYVDLYVDAVSLQDSNQPQQAIEKLNKSVQIKNNFAIGYSLLAQIYQQMNEYQQSSANYEKATQLNPWSFKDYFNLGKVYQAMEEFSKAAGAYGRACELKPNHLEANVGAAKSFYEVKDYNSALIYGQQAEKIDPEVGEIQKILGDIYESRKDHNLAIAAYKRALEKDSDNPDIMMPLAVSYLRSNFTAPAKELLLAVVQKQPNNSDAHKYLGFACLQLGEVDNSITSYSKAIEIDDKDWDAHRGLGVAYIMKGTDAEGYVDEEYKEKALSHWKTSLEINPEQPNQQKILKLIRKYSR